MSTVKFLMLMSINSAGALALHSEAIGWAAWAFSGSALLLADEIILAIKQKKGTQ